MMTSTEELILTDNLFTGLLPDITLWENLYTLLPRQRAGAGFTGFSNFTVDLCALFLPDEYNNVRLAFPNPWDVNWSIQSYSNLVNTCGGGISSYTLQTACAPGGGVNQTQLDELNSTIVTLQTAAAGDAATIAAAQAAAATDAATIAAAQAAAATDAATIAALQTTAAAAAATVAAAQAAAAADAVTIAALQASAAADAATIAALLAGSTDAAVIAALLVNITADAATIAAQANTITLLQASVDNGSVASGCASSPFAAVTCTSASCTAATATVNAFLGNSLTAVSPSEAQGITAALSTVAENVTSAAQLGGVAAALDTLALSMLSGVTTPALLTVAAPRMSMAVGLISTTPGASALFSADISSPGAAASFDALPDGVFAGANLPAGALVRMQFVSLDFDPFGGANDTTVTTLAFSMPDGTPLPLANLTTPITFSMPSPAAAAPLTQAVACTWWDAKADRFSSVGTFALPSPRPPAPHALSWKQNISVENGDFLAESWLIAGPLVAGCTEMILDCRTRNTARIAYDPWTSAAAPSRAARWRSACASSTAPAARCGSRTTRTAATSMRPRSPSSAPAACRPPRCSARRCT
jgi:hypothetical protein